MNQINDYIAVFDSGVGGISVLRELVQRLPNERFLYFGDSANAPYGTRPEEQVLQLALSAAQRLYSRGIKALVIACNTATAVAAKKLRQIYPELIVIGIEPALKPAVLAYPQGSVGIIATPVTLSGGKLSRLMARFPHPDTRLIPAPGLVELVESGLADSPQMDDFLRPILTPYRGQLDALVLGCTHYPFVVPSIRRILGEETQLFDGGPGTARHAVRRLQEAGLLRQGQGSVTLENSRQDPQVLNLMAQLLEAEHG